MAIPWRLLRSRGAHAFTWLASGGQTVRRHLSRPWKQAEVTGEGQFGSYVPELVSKSAEDGLQVSTSS